jgi:antirestriction protein
MSTPRIYVADLACYNQGILHGEWIDVAGMDIDDIQSKINEILESGTKLSKDDDCPHEEHAIHDHEGLPGVGEYTGLERILEIAEAVDEHGIEWITAYLDNFGDDADISDFEDRQSQSFDSLDDFGAECLENLGIKYDDLHWVITSNLDLKGIGEDCLQDYSYSIIDGTYYLFNNN